jgi:hypothetical protein
MSLATLRFTNIRCSRLLNKDEKSRSDPFVQWLLVSEGDESVTLQHTEPVRNSLAPSWGGPYTARNVDLSSGTLRVEVWDKDKDVPGWHEFDDFLGSMTWEAATGNVSGTLDGGNGKSTLSFDVEVVGVPTSEPAATPAYYELELPPLSAVVVRKEIRSMRHAEQKRVFNAMLKMRENRIDEYGRQTRGSSEFFRLAAYHGGFPGTAHPAYCSHGRENFPNCVCGWLSIPRPLGCLVAVCCKVA